MSPSTFIRELRGLALRALGIRMGQAIESESGELFCTISFLHAIDVQLEGAIEGLSNTVEQRKAVDIMRDRMRQQRERPAIDARLMKLADQLATSLDLVADGEGSVADAVSCELVSREPGREAIWETFFQNERAQDLDVFPAAHAVTGTFDSRTKEDLLNMLAPIIENACPRYASSSIASTIDYSDSDDDDFTWASLSGNTVSAATLKDNAIFPYIPVASPAVPWLQQLYDLPTDLYSEWPSYSWGPEMIPSSADAPLHLPPHHCNSRGVPDDSLRDIQKHDGVPLRDSHLPNCSVFERLTWPWDFPPWKPVASPEIISFVDVLEKHQNEETYELAPVDQLSKLSRYLMKHIQRFSRKCDGERYYFDQIILDSLFQAASKVELAKEIHVYDGLKTPQQVHDDILSSLKRTLLGFKGWELLKYQTSFSARDCEGFWSHTEDMLPLDLLLERLYHIAAALERIFEDRKATSSILAFRSHWARKRRKRPPSPPGKPGSTSTFGQMDGWLFSRYAAKWLSGISLRWSSFAF